MLTVCLLANWQLMAFAKQCHAKKVFSDLPTKSEPHDIFLFGLGLYKWFVALLLHLIFRTIDGVLSCYNKIVKKINADQPKADVFSQGMRSNYEHIQPYQTGSDYMVLYNHIQPSYNHHTTIPAYTTIPDWIWTYGTSQPYTTIIQPSIYNHPRLDLNIWYFTTIYNHHTTQHIQPFQAGSEHMVLYSHVQPSQHIQPYQTGSEQMVLFLLVQSYLCSNQHSLAQHTPNVLLLGATGSGKSVQASLIARKYNLVNGECSVALFFVCNHVTFHPNDGQSNNLWIIFHLSEWL
jgi:hypothetical protein